MEGKTLKPQMRTDPTMKSRNSSSHAALLVTIAVACGCAFDVVHVRQTPATFVAETTGVNPWVLEREVRIGIGTGYSTVLKAGTHWQPAGRIAEGDVFKTSDQIVKVEASNIHEAYVVVKEGMVTGFYLPVERTFTAARPPREIVFAVSPEN